MATVFDLFDKASQTVKKAIHPGRLVAEIEEALPDLKGKVAHNTAYTKLWTTLDVDPETAKQIWALIEAHDPKGKMSPAERLKVEDAERLRAAVSGPDAELLAGLAVKKELTKDDYGNAVEALIRMNAVLLALVRKGQG